MADVNIKIVSAIFILIAATVAVSPAQTFTTIADFGATPYGTPLALVQGTDGGLYGTTNNVGDGPGTVFRLSTDGTLKTLYSFCSLPRCADGEIPYSGVSVGTDGNLYGVTSAGGEYLEGTAFRLTLGGALTTIYSFCSQSLCTDGRIPFGGLVEGTDGNLYGTTAAGGLHDDGSIFQITPAGALTTLYSFCSQGYPCVDGYSPEAALTEGDDGNFYGSTFFGGGDSIYSYGTLFKITPNGVFTTLWSFSPGLGGSAPLAPLLQVGDGEFYGTTTGSPDGYGTLFKATSNGKLAVLYSFCRRKNCADGHLPAGALTLGTDGSVYGTTEAGGNGNCNQGCGTIFHASKGKLTTLYSFCSLSGCSDGEDPEGGLTQDTNGVFYGTTFQGGVYPSEGTAFSLDMGLGPFVSFILPAGRIGKKAQILGQGFTGATSVSFNGIAASFIVESDTYLTATVPSGATTGYVTVTTPSGTLNSNVPFRVIP